MEYNITYREKNGGIQVIISYKDELGKWKQKSKQGFSNNREGKKQAKIEADNILQEIKTKITNNINKDLEHITLKQFIDMYLEHKSLYNALRSIETYKVSLKAFSTLYDLKLSKITALDIQQCIDELTKRELKEITIKSYLTKLSTVFNSAINDYNILTKSPIKKIKIKESKTSNEKKALNDEEFNKLIETFNNSIYKNYLPIIIIAGTCGLRIGEILGLTWDDIDFKNKTLTVNKQWKIVKEKPKKIYDFGELKSKNSNRIIPIPDNTLNFLEELKTNAPINYMRRIVKNRSTYSADTFLNRLFKKLGFNITIHELRHTYATKLISNGIDFKTAAKLLGHSVEQTLKTYSHVNDDMMNKASNVISKIF